MKKVLVAGEINVDLILQGYSAFPDAGQGGAGRRLLMVLGSASAICAMGLARLGTQAAFLGKVGDDPWGRYCLECLEGRGIDVTRVVRDPELKTGVTVADHLVARPRSRLLPRIDRAPCAART